MRTPRQPAMWWRRPAPLPATTAAAAGASSPIGLFGLDDADAAAASEPPGKLSAARPEGLPEAAASPIKGLTKLALSVALRRYGATRGCTVSLGERDDGFGDGCLALVVGRAP